MEDDRDDPLCCCEYRDSSGGRSHVLGLCCDCEDFDRLVDGLIKGEGFNKDRAEGFITTAEERLRIPWRGGAIRIPLDAVLPCVLVPGYLWVSALHPVLLLLLLVILPILPVLSARYVIKYRPKSRLLLNISYTLSFCLLYIYEVKLVGLFWDLPKIVSPVENLILVIGGLVSLFLYRRLKVEGRQRKISGEDIESKYCRFCEYTVVERDHHCFWLDVCVSGSNMNCFLLFLVCLTLSSAHLSLILSSAACPGTLFAELLVLPTMCWPYTHNERILLVGGIYSGLVGVLLVILLLHQTYAKLRRRTKN